LFNPYRVVNLYIDFTTGFGLRPSPAAIVVMTPAGSGNVKSRERLQVFYFAPSGRKKTAWGKTPPYGKMAGAAQIAEESPDPRLRGDMFYIGG